MGECRLTLTEANAAGYFSINQIAQAANCQGNAVRDRIARSPNRYDSVEIGGKAHCIAYRLKVKQR
jgi:hypothetical protein